MNKNQWKEFYNELYSINIRYNSLYYDVFESISISKNNANKSKEEMNVLMTTVYYKISMNSEALMLFQTDKNIKDLKEYDQFEWVLTSFLYDLDKYIKSI